MIIPIELRFKADKGGKSVFRTEKTIKSHDVNSVEFHISIDGLGLTDNHTAKILSIFHSSKSQVNMDCEIVEGKIIYKPDTKLISRHEHVTNYVYVYKDNQSLDVCEFNYTVKLSKIDETALEVKTVYDQSYADLLANFEQALSDYKDSLPQADSVRAEIDVILNQFNVDSQAKLNQYDTDAQQVIADNQKRFDLAESVRNEAEESRVQSEEQRASAESSRVNAESSRASAEAERVQAEVERKANEESRELAEEQRENAEAQRKIDHANRSAELAGKADKVLIKNIIENGDFSDGTTGWRTSGYTTGLEIIDGVAKTTDFSMNNRSFIQTLSNQQNTGDSIYVTLSTRVDNPDMLRNMYVLSDYAANKQTTIVGPLTDLTSDFVQLSGVVKYDGTFNLRILYNFKELGEYPAYLKDVVAINLTQTFGAGNEPTKEEMDRLIEITGYIDGEYALNNKEMLGYLMGVKANRKLEDWITPTLLNGTTEKPPSGSAVNTVGYRLYDDGVVRLRGTVNTTGLFVTLFNLPIGYRPTQEIKKVVSSNNAFGLVRVLINGQVILAKGELSEVVLDDIEFDVR